MYFMYITSKCHIIWFSDIDNVIEKCQGYCLWLLFSLWISHFFVNIFALDNIGDVINKLKELIDILDSN